MNSILLDSVMKLQEVADLFEVPFQRVKKCYIMDSRFLYTDFEERLHRAQEVYGSKNRRIIIEATLKQPHFLRSSHSRIIRDKEPFARYILGRDFNEDSYRRLLLDEPHTTCYTPLRDKASIEVGEEAQRDFGSSPLHVLQYIRKSPFIKIDGLKYSLSHAKEHFGVKEIEEQMPEMYEKIRRSIENSRKKDNIKRAA
ncbi:MAG: hypothetical protein ACLFPL_01385 [Candidatus Nanoarchaeia archaeon]